MAKKRKNTKSGSSSSTSSKESSATGTPRRNGSGGSNGSDARPPRRSSTRKPKPRSLDGPADDFKFRNMMEADGLTIIDMNPDGNCLFRALSDQLSGDYGNNHDEVRSEVCDFMEENKDDFAVFLVFEDDEEDDEDAKDFESYISNMRQDGEWGGNLELVAAARLYERKITVYSAVLAAFTIEHGESKSSGPDLLVSFHDNDHYNSVRNNSAPPKPTKGKGNKKKRTPEYDTSTSTDSTSSTAMSLSELGLADEKEAAAGQTNHKKPAKKGSPCPCGSGIKYKKCCDKERKKSTMKLRASKKDCIAEGDEDEAQESTMKGNFRVLSI